jgi:hypothetical protein
MALKKQLNPDAQAFRSPQRITITVAWHVLQTLQHRADYEGRSLSNLAAFELEKALHCKPDN